MWISPVTEYKYHIFLRIQKNDFKKFRNENEKFSKQIMKKKTREHFQRHTTGNCHWKTKFDI